MKITSVSFLTRKTTRFLSIDSVESEEQSYDTSVDDIEFNFLDVGETIANARGINDHDQCHNSLELDLDDDDHEDKDETDVNEKDRCFWDTQHQGLQTNVYRTSSLETKIRNATKEAIKEIESSAERVCVCSTKISGTSCRICLLREVSKRLQKVGFNSAICKTKWRSSLDIPSGEHTFLDVRENTNTKKGEVRVMIEVNFKAEFEMAKGSDEYKKLIKKLPEIFVGKEERLSNLIKILCIAAKKCMKDKKMHMGPWRKQKYMEAKWLGPCERNTSTTSNSIGYAERIITKPKFKASLLTVDLLEKLPTLHCTAVKVL
ncbi:uncharacterized protein LOC123908502 [Trifolium pratense]|uniref:uncharacterized protein LOC123908502 n=1 Tax=Trifolium pratense TaxID=57577 RepID=UPI001E697FBC|nr:uncharacterized protein LOC123908502 [Trifolium pratense]